MEDVFSQPQPDAGPHSHPFNLQTTFNDGHIHFMRGSTSVDPGGLDQHVHYYNGVTTPNDGMSINLWYYRDRASSSCP